MDITLVYTDKSNFLVLHNCSYSAFYLLICSTCMWHHGDVNDVLIQLIFLKVMLWVLHKVSAYNIWRRLNLSLPNRFPQAIYQCVRNFLGNILTAKAIRNKNFYRSLWFPSIVSYALWGTIPVNKSGCRGNAMYTVEWIKLNSKVVVSLQSEHLCDHKNDENILFALFRMMIGTALKWARAWKMY